MSGGGGRRRGRWRGRPGQKGRAKRGGEQRSPFKAVGVWVVKVAGVVTALALIVSTVKSAVGWTHHVIDGNGRVELTRVVVGNGVATYNSFGYSTEQTPASTPQIDLTVHNRRADTVMLEKAIVRVEDSARFPQCIPPQGGGPVPVSRYHVELPLPPTPHGLVEDYSILDRVPPGEDDRPLLLFGARRISTEEGLLYALRIHILTDHGERIDAGRFVLAVPAALQRYGLEFPEDAHMLRDQAPMIFPKERLGITWCFRRNLAALERLLGHPGRRSEDVTALAHMQLARDWPSYADPRPPRAAAEALLHTMREGPELAAFAASRTGDRRFAAQIRARSAALLLKQAEAELYKEKQPQFAAMDARDSLGLSLSARGRILLVHAEAATRAKEAKYASTG